MLEKHLESAILELDILIHMTQEDIVLIKEANHQELARRQAKKSQALHQFENTKNLLNQSLVTLHQESEGDLESVMNEMQSQLLEQFKEKLEMLKEVNARFSKLVIPVNEFFSSLFQGMFHFDSQGYKTTTPKPAAMLRVSA